MTLMVIKLDLVMCWYKRPELVFPLYIFPMLLSGCTAHSIMARRSMVSPRIIWSFSSSEFQNHFIFNDN